MSKEHIERAISIATSQSALAKAIGVTQQTISNWKEGGAIRPEHCSAIERFTGGAVTRPELRPNDWREIWPELVTDQASPVDASHSPRAAANA
ncbi:MULTISPECIES: transcriptional regulator [Burkholderia]|uniref:Helix-turn-helix domain-containing protein n=1 Tax=Burkholderia contaminans TaxID=488447 RepID=A0A2S5DRF7_9BURK|nr:MULTISPECIES: Cro/CI family transcriptional regulator [Burkholderia]EKS9798257.1 helix-turn-helix domain-containing protein [Burkholderia cepacia]EKS9805741.1 helix-turn-helix domain-containing protein [Burkholderia cepacia]EKS9813096.1 helix-turn-helix domain-containing protein [Burkholderia cepacia]EKS9822108.1 helix-turn-helix domain-containing protein [Burkholderia cepacia]EKS9827337.1 helix-turn-helix domain-containing protein [Burkholderia cepacia]